MKYLLSFLLLHLSVMTWAQQDSRTSKYSLNMNVGVIARPLLITGKPLDWRTNIAYDDPALFPVIDPNQANTGLGFTGNLELKNNPLNISLSAGVTIRYAMHYATMPTRFVADSAGKMKVIEWDYNKWGFVTDWQFYLTKYFKVKKKTTCFAAAGLASMNHRLMFYTIMETPTDVSTRVHSREYRAFLLQAGVEKGKWKVSLGVVVPEELYATFYGGYQNYIPELKLIYGKGLL